MHCCTTTTCRVGGGTPKGRCGRRRSRPFLMKRMRPTSTGTLMKQAMQDAPKYQIKLQSDACASSHPIGLQWPKVARWNLIRLTACWYAMHCNEPVHTHIYQYMWLVAPVGPAGCGPREPRYRTGHMHSTLVNRARGYKFNLVAARCRSRRTSSQLPTTTGTSATRYLSRYRIIIISILAQTQQHSNELIPDRWLFLPAVEEDPGAENFASPRRMLGETATSLYYYATVLGIMLAQTTWHRCSGPRIRVWVSLEAYGLALRLCGLFGLSFIRATGLGIGFQQTTGTTIELV